MNYSTRATFPTPVSEGRFHLRNIGARTVTEWCRHLYGDAELAEHEKRVRRVMKLAQRQAKHFAGRGK